VIRFRVGDDVTAEPRMEDLLASIRKAIHEDIGEMPASGRLAASAPAPGPAPAPPPATRAGDELAAAASEIQQLREKISRARAGKPLPPMEPGQRAASLAAALQNETPRRNWRDIEQPPLPRLRGSVAEAEPARPAPRVETPAARVPARSEAATMLSGTSAQAVHSAFGKLAESVLTRATSERSVEEVTRELLRVMLKQWLDENLPAMVERMVREEIERVARTGR
jgi:uncharacterized protein